MGTLTPHPPDLLAQALDGRSGVDGLRRIALQPTHYGLDERLLECLPGAHPRTLHLLRTKYRPGKLTAYYNVLTDADPPARYVVAAVWESSDGTRANDYAGGTEATRTRLTTLAYPHDPDLPQLGRIVDPRRLTAVLGELTHGVIGPSQPVTVDVVRYRPGQRHVLRAQAGPGIERRFLLKIDKDDSGAHAVPAARAIARLLVELHPYAGVACPLGYLASDRLAIWRHAEGQPLWHRVAARPTATVRVLSGLGQALRTLHETGPGQAPPAIVEVLARTPLRSTEVEIGTTARAGGYIGALLPSAGKTFTGLLEDAAAYLRSLPTETPGISHGDLKCDNILVDRAGNLHLVDLDRTGRADPALDLGKLLADLAWWCPDEHMQSLMSSAVRGGYGDCDPARWARASAWSWIYSLRNTARRCAVHDVTWERQVTTRIARVAAQMTAPGTAS